jgi:Uma2 family endonuclease
MELLVENYLENEISAYEIERNKPMPNFTHGAIQSNLVFELRTLLKNSVRVVSEVSLATTPIGSTPDVLIFPNQSLDFYEEPPKRNDAPILSIEIQSPSQSNEEMVEKVHRYFEFGAKSCWIIVPSLQAVLVYDNPFHYIFFNENDVVIDKILNIKLSIQKIFA